MTTVSVNRGRCVWAVVNIIRTFRGGTNWLNLDGCGENDTCLDSESVRIAVRMICFSIIIIIYSTGLFQWIHENLPCSHLHVPLGHLSWSLLLLLLLISRWSACFIIYADHQSEWLIKIFSNFCKTTVLVIFYQTIFPQVKYKIVFKYII